MSSLPRVFVTRRVPEPVRPSDEGLGILDETLVTADEYYRD